MNSLSFTISPARTAVDFADVRQLFLVYAKGLNVDLCFQDFDAEVTTLPGKYSPPEGELLIARNENDQTIGCVAMRRLTIDTCEMKRLYVSPAARGTGLGSSLAKAILATAQANSYRDMVLDSLPTMHEAIALYRKLGFSDIKPYYDTPVQGTVFLGKSLAS